MRITTVTDQYGNERTCLDDEQGNCAGDVEFHESLAGTGTMIPRCERHFEEHLDRDQERRKDFPDSPIAPDWFDPTYAGETWDDEY